MTVHVDHLETEAGHIDTVSLRGQPTEGALEETRERREATRTLTRKGRDETECLPELLDGQERVDQPGPVIAAADTQVSRGGEFAR